MIRKKDRFKPLFQQYFFRISATYAAMQVSFLQVLLYKVFLCRLIQYALIDYPIKIRLYRLTCSR